jgi:lipopolysaccharide biosynthesis glycosyltransferase
VELKPLQLFGEYYMAAQCRQHYSVMNYNQTACSVVAPGDWLLLDRHYNIACIGPDKARELFAKEQSLERQRQAQKK